MKSPSFKIEEEDKALMLLCSLPPSYKNLVRTICYGKDTLIYDEVTEMLRSDDMREKMLKGSTSEAYAIDKGKSQADDKQRNLSRGRSQSRGRSKGRFSSGSRSGRNQSGSRSPGRNTRCYNCNEFGHMARFCPDRRTTTTISEVEVEEVEEDGTTGTPRIIRAIGRTMHLITMITREVQTPLRMKPFSTY